MLWLAAGPPVAAYLVLQRRRMSRFKKCCDELFDRMGERMDGINSTLDRIDAKLDDPPSPRTVGTWKSRPRLTTKN
jgi:hypothetical protein